MKNRYLKSLTARVTILMLSFLCLAGSQGAGAQIPMERRNSSSTSVVSSQKPVMPRMTKSGGNAVSVNGTEYDTWANAVAAINSNATETSFDIVLLNHVMDAKIMPSKACTISGSTSLINFAYINEDSYLTRLQMLAPLTFKNITLQVWQIAANGHALTFDEGVTVVSKYTSGGNDIAGIRNIWGGTDSSSDVASSDITIKSGQFGWICGGSGSTGAVIGTAKITMSGGTVNGYRFGSRIRFANLRFRITFYFFVEISEQRSIGSQMLRHLSRSEKGTDLLFFRGRSLTFEIPFQQLLYHM